MISCSCGQAETDTARFCSRCGRRLDEARRGFAPSPPPPMAPWAAVPAPDQHTSPPVVTSAGPYPLPPNPYFPTAKNDLGKRAMTLGIISLCTVWIPVLSLLVSLPTGLFAVARGIAGRKAVSLGEATNDSQAVVGIVTGSIGAGLCLIAFVVGVVSYAASG